MIDIPVAGWLLSVATFLVGTLLPYFYQRLSHEGFAIRQPHDVRVFVQDDHDKKNRLLSFSTLVKIANARKTALLLDDVTVPSVVTPNDDYEPVGVDVRAIDDGAPLEFPVKPRLTAAQDQLPILVAAESERLIILSVWFRYREEREAPATDRLSSELERTGLRVSFGVDGKDRSYVLKAGKPFQRFSGANQRATEEQSLVKDGPRTAQ